MQADRRPTRAALPVALCAALTLTLGACATPARLTPDELQRLGVRVGAPHWEVTGPLHREGYACFVSGERREQFDCTKTSGFLPTCVWRIRFTVNDRQAVDTIASPPPACTGAL